MVDDELFSDRNDLRNRHGSALLREGAPLELRNYLAAVVDGIHYRWHEDLVRLLAVECDLNPRVLGMHARSALREIVMNVEWNILFDVIEVTHTYMRTLRGEDGAGEFEQGVNKRLLRYHTAYEMRDGHIQELGATANEETIERASAVLSDADLAGPDQAFQEARMAFNRRPKADYRAAVVRAIDALEGTVRVALDDDDVTLGAGITRIVEQFGVHDDLGLSIKALYRYASDEDGLRHGPTAPVNIDRETAELCMSQAAAAMVWIARLHGYGVSEG